MNHMEDLQLLGCKLLIGQAVIAFAVEYRGCVGKRAVRKSHQLVPVHMQGCVKVVFYRDCCLSCLRISTVTVNKQ